MAPGAVTGGDAVDRSHEPSTTSTRTFASPLSRTLGGRRGTAALLEQVAWFNRLRLGAAAGVIWLTALASHALHLIDAPLPLYGLGLLIGLVDAVYLLRFRRAQQWTRSRLRRHVDLQIAIDLLILTALLHFSGGVANPFVLFYFMHAFIAGLLLSAWAGAVVGMVSFGLVVALAYSERTGLLPHRSLGLGLMDVRTMSELGLLLFLLAFGLTLGLSVYFVGTVIRRLRSREAELVHLSGQLAHSEKLASIGTLAAGVSHEINNPIGVIRNKVQILRYRIEDRDDPEAMVQELDVIEKHSRRIGAITEGLLTFSKETPFVLEPLDLNDLVREGMDLVRVPYDSAGVVLRSELTGAAPTIRGSENHLLQVLVNIMLNARDASPEGGEVVVETAVEDDLAAVRIRDQGPGIEEEVLDKVFDPFFTTKEVDRGTGLGLAISHGIVERHFGHIEVASTRGAGTVFGVLLPLEGDG